MSHFDMITVQSLRLASHICRWNLAKQEPNLITFRLLDWLLVVVTSGVVNDCGAEELEIKQALLIF